MRATLWFNGSAGLLVTTGDNAVLVAIVLDITDGAIWGIEAIRTPTSSPTSARPPSPAC